MGDVRLDVQHRGPVQQVDAGEMQDAFRAIDFIDPRGKDEA